jgi:hypothetical protein
MRTVCYIFTPRSIGHRDVGHRVISVDPYLEDGLADGMLHVDHDSKLDPNRFFGYGQQMNVLQVPESSSPDYRMQHDRALPPGFFLSAGLGTYCQQEQRKPNDLDFGSMQIKNVEFYIYCTCTKIKDTLSIFSSHPYSVILCVENLPPPQRGYQIAEANCVEISPANLVETSPAKIAKTSPANFAETSPANIVETSPANIAKTSPANIAETSLANFVETSPAHYLPALEKNQNIQSFKKTRFESYLCT